MSTATNPCTIVAGNPTADDWTGVVHATFDLPTGLIAGSGELSGWKVRKWDGTEVDVTWWVPFVDFPDGSLVTVVAQWEDTIAAGANRLAVQMVEGVNNPPSFVMSSTLDALVNQSGWVLSWTDDDPDWTPSVPGERAYEVDILRQAREGAAIGSPGHAFELWQDRGLSRVYRFVAPCGRGHHHDWLGNTIQGLKYVHAFLLVNSGSDDGHFFAHLRNTAALHDDATPPESANAASNTWLQTTNFPLVRHLGDLRCEFTLPPGSNDVQFRPWGTRNFASGDGPCPIRRLDGATESKQWDLAIRGLGVYQRYPFQFSFSSGTDRWRKAEQLARYPYIRYAWPGCDESRAAVKKGNFAGSESSYGIECGGYEIPPPDIDDTIIDTWNEESEERLDQFLAQTRPGRARWNNGTVAEPLNDPWNLLGYPANPTGGGAQKQFGWFQAARSIYGHSHGDLLMDSVSAARFHSIQVGVVEIRDDEYSSIRDPGEIGGVGYAWGARNSYILGTPTGTMHPHPNSGVQCGRRDGSAINAQRPIYNESGQRCDFRNPDTREAFPNNQGDRRRWVLNNSKHWGIGRCMEVVRAVQDPLLWSICRDHAQHAFYESPDGYFAHAQQRNAGTGRGARASKRMWRTLFWGGYFLGHGQRFFDRILEQVWRMQNDANGRTWEQPWQVINSSRTVELSNFFLCGDRSQGGYDQQLHHDYLWQSAQCTTFFAYLAFWAANQTGATSAYSGESTLREDAAEHIAVVARETTLKAITKQIGIPADRLGLTSRLLDECVDWSDPIHTYGFWWNRKQGYGDETLAGEGGQPAEPNRLTKGVTSGNGSSVGTSGEETNFYPMLKASRIWDAHSDFTADVRARRDYITERLEARESNLASGEDFDTIAGYSSGEWVANTAGQGPSVNAAAAPNVGLSPLAVQLSFTGHAPTPAGSFVDIWLDWMEGSSAPADLRRQVTAENFVIIVPHTFTATASQTRFTVRAVLTSGGETVEGRTIVRANPQPVDADFEWSVSGGTSPVEVEVTDISTGLVTNRDWRAFSDQGDEYTATDVEVWRFQITEPGTWSIELTARNAINQDIETKREIFTVIAEEAPGAKGEVDVTSGSAPLEVTLTNNSTHAGEVYWGEGDPVAVEPGESPSHTYSSGGTFVIQLSATNGPGRVDVWTVTINVDTLAVQQDVDEDLPVVISTGAVPALVIAGGNTDVDLALPPAYSKGLAPKVTFEAVAAPTAMDVALPLVIGRGVAPALEVGLSGELTLPVAASVGQAMGYRAAGDPGTLPTISIEVAADLALEVASASAAALALSFEDQVDLRVIMPPAVATGVAAMRIAVAGSGGAVAEMDLDVCTALATGFNITADTDVSAIDAVTQLELDGLYVEEHTIVGSVAEATENITGFVRGMRKTLLVPIKDGSGNYIPAATLRSSYAHIHIFAARTSELPLVSLTAAIEDVAGEDGKQVRYTFQRGDTSSLEGNTTYFYRVELEFDGDADVPILSGDFSTANQPAMRDDVS